MYQRMQAMIGQCEYTLEKGINTFEMNKQEQKNYDKLRKDIGKYKEMNERIEPLFLVQYSSSKPQSLIMLIQGKTARNTSVHISMDFFCCCYSEGWMNNCGNIIL